MYINGWYRCNKISIRWKRDIFKKTIWLIGYMRNIMLSLWTVTYILINESTRGYGIFIENMLEEESMLSWHSTGIMYVPVYMTMLI